LAALKRTPITKWRSYSVSRTPCRRLEHAEYGDTNRAVCQRTQILLAAAGTHFQQLYMVHTSNMPAAVPAAVRTGSRQSINCQHVISTKRTACAEPDWSTCMAGPVCWLCDRRSPVLRGSQPCCCCWCWCHWQCGPIASNTVSCM
jgi:hypothetical protein